MADSDCCSNETPEWVGGNASDCPSCGNNGRLVQPITIQSLVTEAALERLDRVVGFRFCAEPGCDVAYFNPEASLQIASGDVEVAIGQKLRTLDRIVCYCFHHTAAEIEADVAATGTSEIPGRIGANCQLGLDRCKETNPQGSCCLGNIRQVLKAAQAQLDGRSRSPRPVGLAASEATAGCCAEEVAPPAALGGTQKAGLWATGGAVVSAVLSSACCWLPLLLIAFGASAAGVSGFFEAYRAYLLSATGVLLASGFYLVYSRKESCAPGQACAAPSPRLIRFNKGMLWFASVVVVTFSLFPNYVGALMGGDEALGAEFISSASERLFQIEGMTCEACARTLHSELSAIPGVVQVKVSYDSKTARVFSDPSAAEPANVVIEATIEAAGYQSTSLSVVEAGTASPSVVAEPVSGPCCAP